MTKPETLQFFDKIISDYHVNIEFNAEVYGMSRLEGKGGARFKVESSAGVHESKVLACCDRNIRQAKQAERISAAT